MYLEKNLALVKERLARAAAKKSRRPDEVVLVGVTKTVPVETIAEACKLGLTQLGENRVQETLPKMEALPKEISWHFVGHLQTNKVRFVIPSFHLIQSLDRLKLARELQKEAEKQEVAVKALLQVNIASEKSKHGFHPAEVEEALTEISAFPNITVLGLMTMAPYVPDAEEVRPYFRQLYELFTRTRVPGVYMQYLSMGMTNDFEVAVEEGANMVRIGSAIFGERKE